MDLEPVRRGWRRVARCDDARLCSVPGFDGDHALSDLALLLHVHLELALGDPGRVETDASGGLGKAAPGDAATGGGSTLRDLAYAGHGRAPGWFWGGLLTVGDASLRVSRSRY